MVAVWCFPSKMRQTRPPKSHRFDIINRIGPPKPVAICPKKFSATPDILPGIGCFSNFDMADAKIPIEPSFGGAEEWPGSVVTDNFNVILPFSLAQINATGPSCPGTMLSITNNPSSHMNSNGSSDMPWSRNQPAIAAAPWRPPTSSSCPSAI